LKNEFQHDSRLKFHQRGVTADTRRIAAHEPEEVIQRENEEEESESSCILSSESHGELSSRKPLVGDPVLLKLKLSHFVNYSPHGHRK
jgi:hypothetical protein